MQSLPRELVHEIISYIPIPDLPAFRLTHLSFANLSHEFMFRSIPIEATHESLTHGLSILQNPAIAKYIQELTFIGPRPKRTTVPRSLSTDLKTQMERLRTEGPFQESTEFIEMLTVMFRRLPKLGSIRIRDYISCTKRHLPRSQTPLGRLLAGTVRGDAELSIQRAREKYHLDLFVGVVNAAFEAETSLCEFRCSGMVDHDILRDTETLRRAAKVFSGCKTLDLSFAIDEEMEDPSLWTYENAVCGAISPALRLERLRLSFKEPPTVGGSFPFSALLGTDAVVWPCLKEVQLVMVDMHGHELVGFLKRHAATLEVFLVKDTMLHSGKWVDVVREVKGEMVVLKEFVLVDEVWDPEWGYKYSQEELVEMSEYVLGIGEILPEPMFGDHLSRFGEEDEPFYPEFDRAFW